jgi:DNA-binding PadR family transcriptional regulator
MREQRGRRGPRHIDDELGLGRGRGRGRMRRGDIRTAVLAALLEEPGHGYNVIEKLEGKTEGAWRPSPGSIYPTLQLLEDEGLVVSSERDGKRTYEVTDAGRAEAEERLAAAGGAPWEQMARGGRPHGELREALRQLMDVSRHVVSVGDAAQVERAVAILRDTRKSLYALLSED